MKRPTPPRRQRPIKGGRIPAYAGLIQAIEDCIERDMRRFNVCRSFVIATHLGHIYGVDDQEDFTREPGTKIGDPVEHKIRRVK